MSAVEIETPFSEPINPEITEISRTSHPDKQSLMQRIGSLLLRFKSKPEETLPLDKSAECPYFMEKPETEPETK